MAESFPIVVALESSLIAHGLPFPDNLAAAEGSEAAVKAAGAEPKTIAVLAGQIRVGLTWEQIQHLATAEEGTVLKASRRDLALAVSQKRDAATTVSATMFVARSQGIQIMATGGLGGVHRGAGSTFDVSTDLDELARADGFVVVCSGVKSILDMPATLEWLETSGIAVVGYDTDEFPAFTTRSSGLPLETRVNSPVEAAEFVRTHRRLGLPGGIVIAQPLHEGLDLPREEVEASIEFAIQKAERAGIKGKAITPFLLDTVRSATEGRSLRANMQLIINNASLAAKIAVELAKQS
jgi:pseudouridine-5'-phosphate glycosidase